MADSTLYFVSEHPEDRKGHYTLPQLINLWRNGAITATAQFWTETDDRWRPIKELQLDAPDAEEANKRIVQIYQPESGKACGPFSLRDLREGFESKQISPAHWFWWPGLSHWIDIKVFQLSLDRDPNIQFLLDKTLSAPAQLEPPTFDKQWTQKKQLLASLHRFIVFLVIFLLIIGAIAAFVALNS